LYRWLYGRYLKSAFGKVDLVDMTPAMVRHWRHDLLADKHTQSCSQRCADRAHRGISPTMVAKAYRLLRAVLMTAVDDELIKRNPCRVSGAGTERPSERPVLTLSRYVRYQSRCRSDSECSLSSRRSSPRFGEVTALERRDIDLARGTVCVRQAYTEAKGQGMVLGPPKSRAGLRTVSLPSAILDEIAEHMRKYTGPGRDALVITGPKEAAIRRSNFNSWSTGGMQ
jgi:integrase